jgi:hypothetical protein
MPLPLRVAFADPPYLGRAKKHYAKHHRRAAIWDRLETHARLIERLLCEFPDGWALSCGSTNLRALLPLCPRWVRIGAWVKPFAFFKPGVNPAYAWEPVLFTGGRRPGRRERCTVRDWIAVNNTFGMGLPGAKPLEFCLWICDLLNLRTGDTLVDLFPGTGIMKQAFQDYCRGRRAVMRLIKTEVQQCGPKPPRNGRKPSTLPMPRSASSQRGSMASPPAAPKSMAHAARTSSRKAN